MEIGKQYKKDDNLDKTGFLKSARLHQSIFRSEKLKLGYDTYGNYLKENDAKKGSNFFNGLGVFEDVKKRYKKYSKNVYANMLRSEHIAFNLFSPLKNDPLLAKSILNRLLTNKIHKIESISIEYAPSPANKYLNDKTSFDVYIEILNQNSEKGVLGIEVKYTERSYKLKKGSKEEQCVNDKESIYYEVSKKSKAIKNEFLDQMGKDKYRQIWRNHLLGESILLNEENDITFFQSITIAPKANEHIETAIKNYQSCLVNKERIKLITYEDFIESIQLEKNNNLQSWSNYLKERYIVKK